MATKGRLLLVYPKTGASGELVRHMPLSILYAAVDSIKSGIGVDILDLRLNPDSWEQLLAAKITHETLLVGISVMTGTPIRKALEISRWVKARHPSLPVVWGGPHASFNAEEILLESSVDYAVSGYGSRPLQQLAAWLRREPAVQPENIHGLTYRQGAAVRSNPPEPQFEMIDYRDIPYDLIEPDMRKYGQLDSDQRIFPMYSLMGCPYNCAFCSSPALYKHMKRRVVPISPQEVVDHIQYVHEKYGATYIYFIDDDSFVKLDHVETIIDEIVRRGIRVKLGFRGARVNEIMLMSDAYLTKLARVGTDILHIGAESGSQRILDMVRKNCTVDDIIQINRKLARHPEITAAYNWIVGIPGETTEDLRLTRRLVVQLLKDNPRAIVFIPNKFRPLPGTELYEEAVCRGYAKPTRLEEWMQQEAEGDFQPPWYSPALTRQIRMFQVTSYFIDDKLFKVKIGRTFRFRFFRAIARLYSPVAYLRFRYGITFCLLEYWLYLWIVRRYQK